MSDENLNYENLEASLSISSLDELENEVKSMESGGVHTMADSGVKDTICRVYGKVKPILKGIVLIPFIPAPVKRAVDLLCRALDGFCGRS